MRLLNAKTLEFADFFDSAVPEYIILSHRWEGNETTFQEFKAKRHLNQANFLPSILKIKLFCAQTLSDGYEWCWVDTCCIDKTSSAELTEAINSMWRWYSEARACYVYLSDIKPINRRLSMTPTSVSLTNDPRPSPESIKARLQGTAWFTRGWTLQELLAPKQEFFFDAGWNLLGDRDQIPLLPNLEARTGICGKYFGDHEQIRATSIAERMLWISKRQTSRVEDIAYCMLGIFNVHMPLIYGEGLNAFLRLQLEIIKASDDETIFAWTGEGRERSGLLAEHPRDFGGLAGQQIVRRTWLEREPFAMTNKGMEIQVFDTPLLKNASKAELILNCQVKGEGWVVVSLGNVDGRSWCRTNVDKLFYAQRLLAQPTPLNYEPPNFHHMPGHSQERHKRFKIFVKQHPPFHNAQEDD